MKRYRILLWIAGTVLLFTFFTAFSYRGGMPYAGDTTMGFPLIFLRKSVGQNLETGLFAEIKDFNIGYLFIDVFFSVLLVVGLFKLFRFKYVEPNEDDN
ncbi:hypothetical protein RYH73_08555 [Olivibacter sp. CPCC 100613]|uniref:hypothetical protein n=1 Tax=Olivibacter sp. CPCC 100613 TaxID=3079931 RepID=UPI002FF7DAC3